MDWLAGLTVAGSLRDAAECGSHVRLVRTIRRKGHGRPAQPSSAGAEEPRFSAGASRGARRLIGGLGAFLLTSAPVPARASESAWELSSGVSVGGIMAGVRPRLAVSPHLTLAWQPGGGFLLAANEMVSIVPATDPIGVGVYSQTSTDIGFAWTNASLSLGPLIAAFSTPACGQRGGCKRVEGIAPGVHLQANLYLAGPLGVSIWSSIDWATQGSGILPSGSVTGTVLIGPVLRWRTT